jgi:DNA-binding response OmpR family regulator
MSSAKQILVVDDEPSVVEVVSLYLEREGFQVRQARDGREALSALAEETPALMVLDLMLPHVDGLEIMRQLRGDEGGAGEVPVIMLTARSQETDRIYGLELGADDYVTKPFSPAELVARVRAVLRRTEAANREPEAEKIVHGELAIDVQTRQVTVRGETVDLTATEFNLLSFMARHPQQVFSREQLLENVWGFSDYVDPSTVTVHIRRLREKIEVDPGNPEQLLTVWGVGYRFQPAEGASGSRQ